MSNLERAPIMSNFGLAGRRSRLLASYLLNRKRGTAAVRKMIHDDIGRFDDLGARAYAGELREVLKRFESAVDAGQ
jgi:hypothetical protein